ncbi:prevent-host-death protein [Clostridia bacterium]|nr:prevent-host-death protein [Clostridia bacterium]
MPQIIPIRELKNAAKVTALCKESAEPVFVTRNGYGELVVMSIEAYDRLTFEIEAAVKLSEACAPNVPTYNAKEAFGALRAKYARQ